MNTFEFSQPASVAAAALVLVAGRAITGRVALLQRYAIPVAVTGGLIAALLVLLAHGAGVGIAFAHAEQPWLMLAFFASVGLGADLRAVLTGGRRLLLFFACICAMLALQNIVGTAVALATGQNPALGLLAGSVTMSGGHGTGAAWGARFETQFNLAGATGIALAAATFGLVCGGLLGGPVGARLVDRVRVAGKPLGTPWHELPHDGAAATGALDADRVIVMLFLVAASIAAGLVLAERLDNPVVRLPSFVWVLVVGVALRNILSALSIHEIDGAALDFVGTVALSMYLAMALMTLRLWELADLALPMLAILAAQVALMYAFVTQITFRVMGGDYDAALLGAAQCGFGLGATPTAMANMDALARRHGYSVTAFLIAPVIGAFMIDVANAFVISLSAQALAR